MLNECVLVKDARLVGSKLKRICTLYSSLCMSHASLHCNQLQLHTAHVNTNTNITLCLNTK